LKHHCNCDTICLYRNTVCRFVKGEYAMDQYHLMADYIKALAHPTRLQILELLRSGERCVCEIFPELKIEQSSASRHLALLKKEGLLRSRKEGLKVIYWTSDPLVYEIIDRSSESIKRVWQEKAEILS
jgi:DNA-binding transcriptional ArsR family regulator